MRPIFRFAPLCRLLFVTLASLAGLTAARAQVTFTITATADATNFGYTAGQVVTFVFQTTSADLSGNAHNTFTTSDNLWLDDLTSDTPVFTSVSGTGLAGTFTRPTVTSGSPFSAVGAIPPGYGQLSLQAKSEAFSLPTIGLSAQGYALEYLLANQLDWGQSFAAPGNYTSLAAFFAPYVGTHTLAPGGYVEFYAGGVPMDFTPLTLSITISAIPEPSTTAALAGTLVLGAVIWRRRQGRVAS